MVQVQVREHKALKKFSAFFVYISAKSFIDAFHVNQDVNRGTISNKPMNTYLDVVCYRSKLLADGSSPIMLRLTKSGKRKYVSLHLSVKPTNWDFNKNTPKRNCPNKEAINAIIEKKSIAYRDMITQLKVEGNEYTLDTLVQRVEKPIIQQRQILNIDILKRTFEILYEFCYIKFIHKPQFAYSESSIALISANSLFH